MSRAPSSADSEPARVTRVSELVGQIRSLLERNIALGWVAGEVSNLVHAASGHVYFTLRDAQAQIRCTMWRSRAQLLPFRLAEGMQIDVRAQVTVYEPRGDLQLSVDMARRAGLGSLYEAYLRLKARLEAEGLFAPERKQAIPPRPAGIALVTSASGAALHDVVTVLRRRAPALPVTLYPSLVQGDAAPAALVRAIQRADARAVRDRNELLIVCRGGGSLEDLWAFNHEDVVRAIAACQLPVISGVGHETDTTLADFAADLRAATPSAAAEIASAGWFALGARLPELERALAHAMQRRLALAAQRVDELQRRLAHPRTRLARNADLLASLGRQLQARLRERMRSQQQRLQALDARLQAQRPRTATRLAQLGQLEARLRFAQGQQQRHRQQRLGGLAARLESLAPAAVLARGYAIVRDADGHILRDTHDTQRGAALEIELAHGRLRTRVEDTDAG